MDIAKRYNLKVIEDCAQADGGSCKGKRLGTFGDAGCFSFDFYKIINTGEGGMVVTNDEKIYIRTQSCMILLLVGDLIDMQEKECLVKFFMEKIIEWVRLMLL